MENLKEIWLNKLLVGIILIVSILTIHNFSIADETYKTPVEVEKHWGSTMANMPQNNISGSTGMMPQLWTGVSGRMVTLPSSRLLWKENDKWKATINGAVVYCAHHGTFVRYAKYDSAIHYLIPNNTVIQGANLTVTGKPVSTTLAAIIQKINDSKDTILKGKKYYTKTNTTDNSSDKSEKTASVTSSGLNSLPGGEDAIGYYVLNSIEGDYSIFNNMDYIYVRNNATEMAGAQIESSSNLFNLLNALGNHIRPSQYSGDIDNPLHAEGGITAIEGPEVVVIEQSTNGTHGYKITASNQSYSNDQKAYILTALENVYDANGNNVGEYSLNDIQTAYWLALGQEPGNKGTAKGRQLYQYAIDYATFLQQIAGGYEPQVSINTKDAQVIVDRNNQTYTVGPFSIDYPEYLEQDISYIKSLSINDGELLYDETHSDFKLILEKGGTGTSGANGMKKPYPTKNEKFFIQFSASQVKNAKSIDFSAQFEYISNIKVNYDKLTSTADVYKYYGYCLFDEGDYAMKSGTVEVILKYKEGYDKEVKIGSHTEKETVIGEDGQEIEREKEVDDYETRYYNENKEKKWTFTVYQPYIKMGDTPTNDSAQPHDIVDKGEREYTVVSKKVTTVVNEPPYGPPPEKPVNLTMELGGYVWVDEDGGKESVSNGTADSNEKRVPHVKVTLSDGQTTTTNDKGEYRFYNLDPMKQYSVTFEYNGQYYQPTKWEPSSTWFSGTWQTNSNAKDKEDERTSFNLKFASIGSSPENYKGSNGTNRTYTKQELLDAGIIDEFGNLVGNGNSSMVQYVKDCMMKAYTFDVYPYPSIFVIDGKPITRDYLTIVPNNGKPTQLYPNAFYINLGLNPREESDLAIKKDVDHVTLEINGQTHTYTYDTLENKENAENEWDISVRLSDAYYNTAYTRELYKSDYLYKASMYGDKDENNDGIGDAYGKRKADELEVYITYKIMVRNQAMSIRARVDELVDYYDEDLEYVDGRSYIEIKQSRENAAQKGKYSVKASVGSKYSSNTVTDITGYDNLYITGLGNMSSNEYENYLAAGQTAYIYLTFKVKKEARDGEDWVKLDEKIENGEPIGVGKENIVEVNGYSTQYPKGAQVPNIGDVSFKPAGIVDTDSNPGNLADTGIQKDKADTSVFTKFEDDTDKAPNIRIILYRDDEATRVISGSVWEDARTQEIGVTTTGDGFKDENATMINGVTVQLVELMENGTEYVWREFGDNNIDKQNGLGGDNTKGKGTGSGTVTSETPIINAYNLIPNYEFGEKHDGQYAFKSFMPGKFVVRFIYGDTERTVTPASLNMGGLNEKSYNGQDYKSATYQKGVQQHKVDEQGNILAENKTYTWREKSTWGTEQPGQEILGKVLTEVSTMKDNASNNETTQLPKKDENGNFETISVEEQKGYLYDITESEKYNGSDKDHPLVSDAKDIESKRNAVNDYSDNDVTNYIAEVLASHKADYTTLNDRNQLLKDLMSNTKMTAETGLMVIELEYDRTGTPNQTQNNKASYKIQNVDLGLEERPKAQLVIDKEVTNVKLTLADGSILFDAKDKATNVLWKDHKAYQVGYKGNVMDPDKFGDLQNIRNKNASKFGLVQLTMDEELMHGATIEITYQVGLTNVGEVDYKDNLFYYTGNKSENAQVVTTKANQVIDYVANNLQFNAQNNSNWHVISKDDIKAQGLVNSKLESQVDKYNTIIVTEALNKDLVPNLYKEKVDKDSQDSISVPLVLTQLITSENDTDDLTYRNLVEIVKTSNTVGRRMEYSVVGNQDPEANPQELDSDIAEVVRILPPFGNALNYTLLATIAIAAISIITGGIIFIKKKVLRK